MLASLGILSFDVARQSVKMYNSRDSLPRSRGLFASCSQQKAFGDRCREHWMLMEVEFGVEDEVGALVIGERIWI